MAASQAGTGSVRTSFLIEHFRWLLFKLVSKLITTFNVLFFKNVPDEKLTFNV